MAEETTTEETTETVETTTGVDELAGLKSALEKEREGRRSAEKEAKAHAAAAKRLAEIEEQSKSEHERAVTAARKEGEDSVRAELTRERVLDRIEVLAAKDFEDAEDARLRLAGRVDEFVSDGQIDSDSIKAALAQLLKDKSHLAAKGDGRPRGDVDQGVRNGKQLTGAAAMHSLDWITPDK